MKKFLKFVGWAFGIMIVLGVIANLTGEADPPKEEPKKEVVQEKPKEEPKEEPKVEEPDYEAEAEYTSKLGTIMTDSSIIMSDLTILFSESATDPSVILDPTWRQDIVDVYAQLGEQREKVIAIENVPPKLQEVHNLTIESFDLYLSSRDHILTGIDTMNPDHIYEGVDVMSQGTEKLTEVQNKLTAIIEEML
jgi:hypothetical protein